MTKKQHWVLYGMCWSMYPIIHSSVSRKMSTWEEWRVGPYHQPWSKAHPPPHQSAVLCGRWLHQWVEQDMVTTKIWWPALYLNKDLLVLKLFVHFFANCSLLYLFVIWYMFACVPQHTGQERVWSACPSITSSNYHHPLVRWMMTQ